MVPIRPSPLCGDDILAGAQVVDARGGMRRRWASGTRQGAGGRWMREKRKYRLILIRMAERNHEERVALLEII